MKSKKFLRTFFLGMSIVFLFMIMSETLHSGSDGEVAISRAQAKVVPSLKIVYFRSQAKKGSSETLLAPSALKGALAGTSVALGEDVTLTWRVEAVGMSRVTASITGIGSVNIGTPQSLSTGGVFYVNNRSVLPTRDTNYTLRVTGVPVDSRERAKVVEQSFRVAVRAPVLDVQQPTVDQDTRRVELFVRNSGETDFRPTPIQVHYVITGQSPTQSLAERRFTTSAMEIRRGQRVSLGTTTLPEGAWRSRSLRILVEVDVTYTTHLESNQTFTHTWRENTLTLDAAILRLVGMAISGQIRINNYTSSVSDPTTSLPHVRNDSVIELMGVRRTYDIPYIKFGETPTEWFFFFNNLNVHRISGEDLLFIRDGKLGMHIEFDSSVSNEVKGWARDAVAKNYKDDWCPDVDITRLNLDILLTPSLRGQRISYSRVEVVSDINLRITGRAWRPLDSNLVRRYVIQYFEDYVNSQFSPLLMNDTIRSEVEDGLNDQISSMGTIHYFVDLIASGSEIRLVYR